MQRSSDNPDDLFASAYAQIHSLTLAQAQATLRRADQSLYQSWNDLKSIDDVAWRQAADDQPRGPHDLAHAAASFDAYLRAYRDTDDDRAALGVARHYLSTPATTVIGQDALSALYQGVLQRGLHWIDPAKVRAAGLSPAQILQTVCRHRQPAIATRAALAERLQHYRDVIADEAALILFNAQVDQDVIAHGAPIHVIRAGYASALIDEWQDAALGLSLLPSAPIAPVHAKFWYDGVVMQNTRGKGMEQIVSELFDGAPYEKETDLQSLIDQAGRARRLLGQPDGPIAAAQRESLTYAMHGVVTAIPRYTQRAGAVHAGDIADVWLTRDELYAIVDKAMGNLMLDVQYASGTPLNAIATIVRRLSRLHGVAFDEYNNPTALMAAYNRLEQTWRDDPHSPLAPSLYAAHTLAKSSNVLLLDAQSALSRRQQIAQQVKADLLPAISAAGRGNEIAYWTKTIDDIAEGIRPTNPRHLIAFLPPKMRPLYQSIGARISALKQAPETIYYQDAKDLDRQLQAYLAQRLLAHAPLPVYDEDIQIEWILRQKLGMTDADLRTARQRIFHRPPFIGSTRSHPKRLVTPTAEFKARMHPLDAGMTFKSRTIDTAKEWESARGQAAAALLESPAITAKAMEILRQNAKTVEPREAEQLRSALTRSIMGAPQTPLLDESLNALKIIFISPTVTAMLTALFSGEPRKILELLPFVIPLWDIEEGLRLHDGQRAMSGAIHLSVDAILTLLGGFAQKALLRPLARDAEAMLLARARMAPEEHAVVDMTLEMMDLFPQVSPDNLAQRRVTIAEDTFNVHTAAAPVDADAAQTMPKTLLESPHRTPDNVPHKMLYLIDEKQSVPVAPIAGGFAETDLRGNIIVKAPMIFGDLENGRGYRLSSVPRLRGWAAINAAELVMRDTVSSVRRYWQSIASLRNIRVRRAEPKRIVNALFTSENGVKYAAFEQFWLKVYARSDTAVAILNAAYDRLATQRHVNAEITFNAGHARVVGNEIHYLGDTDLAGLRYISINGETPFQRSRMWLHEALHWLAKIKDAPEHVAFSHRGGAIYLTDLILSELGYYPPIPARIAYKTPPVFHADETAHRAWAANLRQLHDWSVAENRLLDKLLYAGCDFPSSLMILGQKITDRVTVVQGLALARYIKTFPKFGAGNVQYLFQLLAFVFDFSVEPACRDALETLLTDSATFREIAAAWARKAKYARIRVERGALESIYSIAHAISGKTILLNDRPLYYFSNGDVTDLSPLRQYAGALVDFFLCEMIPAKQALLLPNRFTERGIGVLLENEILRQAGDDASPRICLELTSNLQHYIRPQTTVSRAVVSENGYLRQAARDGEAAAGDADDDILGLTEQRVPASPV